MDALSSPADTLDETTKKALQNRLIEWFRRERRALPWRHRDDPFAVLVSEVMLQQTQVATVIPYFERFMTRFPTLAALAAAPIAEVLRHWQGLGYYSRARNLHRAAREIVDRFDGEVPADVEALRSLPGIGPYTAGAVASIAFNRPEPILDGNVMRVLTRLFCIEGNPKAGRTHRVLWEMAQSLVPADSPRDFNVALMELGALLCTRARPQCGACPVAALCGARERNEVSRFPEVPPHRAAVAVEHVATLVARNDAILLAKRPASGRWGGLWELPRVERADGEPLPEAAARATRQVCGAEVTVTEPFGTIRHSVTRYRIRLHGFRADWRAEEPRPIECDAVVWARLDRLEAYAFSAPQRRLLRLALSETDLPRLF